ncbi:MAG: sn-glycerol-3-phosphate ABC transporter ATP-binding protein UgpC [Gemmatimonadota bacterium]|nr:sn-glycerol-3-phosphate ABC transporter ATP-binding protein UgpC [Gemmatimonadota bacterium]
MARVTLSGMKKMYDDGTVAVHDVSLDVADGEFVVLVGPSGCGKSTTLRMIAGLETISAGELRIGDRVVNDVPPARRDIAMVFQSYALYPHMSVRDNMGFALRLQKRSKLEIAKKVLAAAEVLGLETLLDRTPRQLSGGQRQRVAIGRALVREPQVFLFDEPLSNLDAKLRAEMRRELAALHRRLGTTMIYVTHDQLEAMTLGDRIVVMNQGRVCQIGAPTAVYDSPNDIFVATFLGSPPMNLLAGSLVSSQAGTSFRPDAQPGANVSVMPAKLCSRSRVIVGVRPEHLRVGPETSDPHKLSAVVELVEPLGHDQLVHLRMGDVALVARTDRTNAPSVEARVWLSLDAGGIHLFDETTGSSAVTPRS